MNRRRFIGAGAAALVAMPGASRAQESAKPWRIGFLEAGAPAANQHFLDAFKRGLSEHGYAEGGNVVIVERWGDGQVDRFPALLNELVQEKVDIIVVASTAGAVVAKATIKALPVVFVGVQDPVGVGIVGSLGRPGPNLTGFSQAEEEGLVGKRLELFKEAVPPVDRLGLIWNPTAPGVELRLKEARKAATRFMVTLRTFEVRDARELDGIFVTMTKERLARLMVLADPLTVRNHAHIVELAPGAGFPRFIHSWSSRAWAVSWPMARAPRIYSGTPRGTWTGSSRAPGPAICPSSSPRSSSWSSTSRWPGPSAWPFRPPSWGARTRSSNEGWPPLKMGPSPCPFPRGERDCGVGDSGELRVQ